MPCFPPPASPPTLLHSTADHRKPHSICPSQADCSSDLASEHLTLPLSTIFAVFVPPPPSPPQLSFTAGVPCFPSADLPHSAPCFTFSPKSHGEAHKLRQATQNNLSYQQSFRRKSHSESPVNVGTTPPSSKSPLVFPSPFPHRPLYTYKKKNTIHWKSALCSGTIH